MKFDPLDTLVDETAESPSVPKSVDPKLLQHYKERFQNLTRGDVLGECIIGCGLAGSIYMLLLFAYFYWGTMEVLGLILLSPFLMVLGFIVGTFSASMASLIIIPINASLDWILNSISQSFVVGGLSGFFPAATLLMMTCSSVSDLTLLGFLATSASMTIGHLCAYRFTQKVTTEQLRRTGSASHSQYEAATANFKSSRFGLTHLMIFTAWTAVGFMFISMLPNTLRDFLATLYLITQAASGLTAILIIWSIGAVSRYRQKTRTAIHDATVT